MVKISISRVVELWRVFLCAFFAAAVAELLIGLLVQQRSLSSRPIDLALIIGELALGATVVFFVRQRNLFMAIVFLAIYTWTLIRVALFVFAAVWLV